MEKASSVALWVNPDTSLSGLFGNTWQLVFEVEAFSGIDILPYLRHGTISARAPETSVDSHKIFRHPDLITKLETASLIKILYYDLGMQNVVHELRFSGNGNSETWFSSDSFEYASSWNIDASVSGLYVNIELQHIPLSFSRDFVTFIVFSNFWNGCDQDLGWSFISQEDISDSCGYYSWQNNPNIAVPNVEVRAPVMMVATSTSPVHPSEFVLSGKVALEVLDWRIHFVWVIMGNKGL